MTFESATHRVRRVGDQWHAERKSLNYEHMRKLGEFADQNAAQAECEKDAYRLASGR